MGPDTQTPDAAPTAGARCPSCRAAVRPDAPWCTQCWTDLRTPVAERPVAPATSGPLPGAAAARESVPGRAGWPCTGCGAANPVELDDCQACGTGFLAGLRREQPPLLVLPGVGDVSRLSRAQRLGLAGGVVLIVLLLTLALGLLSGY